MSAEVRVGDRFEYDTEPTCPMTAVDADDQESVLFKIDAGGMVRHSASYVLSSEMRRLDAAPAPSPPPAKPAGKRVPQVGDVYFFTNDTQREEVTLVALRAGSGDWDVAIGVDAIPGISLDSEVRDGMTFIRSANDVTEGAAESETLSDETGASASEGSKPLDGQLAPIRAGNRQANRPDQSPPPPSPPLVIPGPCGLITRSGLPCGLVEGHKGRPCEVLPWGERPIPAGVSAGELRELASGPWRKRGGR